ncbi:MAG: 4Fe-4S dicluster domain-containing protein, partial [Anaerolineaceae bacterium]|nr:4Fe-4S dicluster domain-containing protein [Anaerolineaceae bacterium]
WRSNPGLLSPDSYFANPFTFAIADASFTVIASLHKAAQSPVSGEKVPLDQARITSSIKSLAKYLGALDVGICLLRPEFIYSHEGRYPDTYGEPIDLKHKFAVVMTFEMDHEMMGSSPKSPVVMESAHQYLEGARTSLQLATAIHNLGYEASAHYDGNYQVICPPIARDAGLGEIGRMSILITPHQGPRVRLAIVTTDLPLMPDKPKIDVSVLDFCSICKKCATNCPAQAILYNKREPYKGVDLWRINADACYTYWTQCGTDCGHCMTVCPYAHASSFYHEIIRWGIRHSGFFRRSALLMDNLFYGKNPKPRPAPSWTKSAITKQKH